MNILKYLIILIFSTFIYISSYSQNNTQFTSMYGNGKDLLFFKNNKLKFLSFNDESFKLMGELNYKLIDNKIVLDNYSEIQINSKNQVNEHLSYKNDVFYRIWNFVQLYTSLGYSSDILVYKYGQTENTTYLFNDDSFCEYFNISKISSNNSFDFIEQYIINNQKYIENKKNIENEKNKQLNDYIDKENKAINDYLNKENQEKNNKFIDDSVKLNTFPQTIFYRDEKYKESKVFLIKKQDDGIKIQFATKYENIDNYHHIKKKLVALDSLNCDIKIKEKIIGLMSDKPYGIYYLSMFVYTVRKRNTVNLENEDKLIEVEYFFNFEYNKKINTVHKENNVQYYVSCEDCIISYADKNGEFDRSSSDEDRKIWVYNFNDSFNIKKYLANPFSTKVYGISGQYVYLRVINKKEEGDMNIKILVDGKVWMQSDGKDSIILSGFLP